jgi:hypothetical protein
MRQCEQMHVHYYILFQSLKVPHYLEIIRVKSLCLFFEAFKRNIHNFARTCLDERDGIFFLKFVK